LTNSAKPWYVYILRCKDNSLYTGVTVELERRVHEHNHCNIKGARYTRARRPVTLVYNETSTNRSSACQREHHIKTLTKKQKEALLKLGNQKSLSRTQLSLDE